MLLSGQECDCTLLFRKQQWRDFDRQLRSKESFGTNFLALELKKTTWKICNMFNRIRSRGNITFFTRKISQPHNLSCWHVNMSTEIM